MPFEHEGIPIHDSVAVSAPDFHPGGIDVMLGAVPSIESCVTAGAVPLLLHFVFQCNAAPAGGRGNEVVPSGVDRIRLRSPETKCQRLLFRQGHKCAAHRSVVPRGNGIAGCLAWDAAGRWSRCLFPLHSYIPLGRHIFAWARPRSPRPDWMVRPVWLDCIP